MLLWAHHARGRSKEVVSDSKDAVRTNYVLTDVRRNFNTYYNTDFNDDWPIGQKLGPNEDDYRWYWTAFLRCEAIDVPQPLINVDEIRELSVEIYRDDEAWGMFFSFSSSEFLIILYLFWILLSIHTD